MRMRFAERVRIVIPAAAKVKWKFLKVILRYHEPLTQRARAVSTTVPRGESYLPPSRLRLCCDVLQRLATHLIKEPLTGEQAALVRHRGQEEEHF